MQIKKLAILSLVLILSLGMAGCSEDDSSSTKYDLTVEPKREERGEVTVDPQKDKYEEGTGVTLAPSGKGEYSFAHWEGSGYDGNTDNPLKIKMTIDVNLVAVFTISEMVEVQAGTAADGSTSIDYDIEMGKYEVTHAEFIQFLNSAGVASDGSYEAKKMIDMDSSGCAVGHDGSFYFEGSSVAESEDTPVIEVTWYGALAYCNWLSEQEGLTPAYDLNNWELKNSDQSALEGYRLPTSTEWEYAARGGDNGNSTTYAGSDTIADVAWYTDNSNSETHPVGEKQANELGIYDMSGNVYERTNTPEDTGLVGRGGSYSFGPGYCEVVDNGNTYDLSHSGDDLGFRLTKTKQEFGLLGFGVWNEFNFEVLVQADKLESNARLKSH